MHVTGIVAIEDVTKEAAIEVSRGEQPVGDRIGQIEVLLHHDRLIVVRDMMTADRIHERNMADGAVIPDVTAPVEELVVEVDPHWGCHVRHDRIIDWKSTRLNSSHT